MILIPAGVFTMGPSAAEKDRFGDRSLPHKVIIARPFAVSRFDVTFADWDACVAGGGCPEIGDAGFGRGTRPMINVTWNDAQLYVAWLSRMSAKPYRLLTEAEWEYAARAGTATAYFWGDEVGAGNADCNGCGSTWDNRQTAPAGSFKPNAFGLYDMAGNVWQWVEDCYHADYAEAPADGSARTTGDCRRRVARGGSWVDRPEFSRSAHRLSFPTGFRIINLGFRVARTLTPTP
jgi:formylglycine-generating enzyme required for sulfatase activity